MTPDSHEAPYRKAVAAKTADVGPRPGDQIQWTIRTTLSTRTTRTTRTTRKRTSSASRCWLPRRTRMRATTLSPAWVPSRLGPGRRDAGLVTSHRRLLVG